VDEDAFQRELDRRTAARQSGWPAPMDNPRARIASASSEARQRRTKLADDRAARIHAAHEKRDRAAKAAQEEAFRRAKEQARRAPGAARGGARPSSSSQGRSAGGFPFQRKDDKIAAYYKVLDLPYGASYDEVKKSYRQLMRKYHPDRHVSHPKKQKAATELSMRVTQAYNALEEHLKKK
jgi:DnaJ-domain-containing protein 1